MLIQNYESHLLAARNNFVDMSGVGALINEPVIQNEEQKRRGAFFLLVMFYYGISMTRQVESWVKRAGESCINLGVEDVGKKLVKHARGEANHNEMYERDVNAILAYINEQYDYAITWEDLQSASVPTAIQEYADLHEDNIRSTTPYNQIAIEYEIENLSICVGPMVVEFGESIFGDQVEKYMTFIHHHVELDVAHTKFNRMLLSKIIERCGDDQGLIDTGKSTLSIYSRYLKQCVDVSDTLYARYVHSKSAVGHG